MALAVSAPAGLAGFDVWRAALVASVLVTLLLLRDACPGCRTMRTHMNRTTPLYLLLYTLGFSTLVYWVWIPGDLLVVNGLIQATCLKVTGNTAHGWLAGVYSVRT